jgi:hypothetical protein
LSVALVPCGFAASGCGVSLGEKSSSLIVSFLGRSDLASTSPFVTVIVAPPAVIVFVFESLGG